MTYPHKPASADYPILDPIKERWSPRAFSDRPIEEEKIRTLFEAARWAPSSNNGQPWRYIYTTKEEVEERAAMESLLDDYNYYAKRAYLLIAVFAQIKRTRTTGEIVDNYYGMHDTGAASAYLVLQCAPLGLIGHQMGGFATDKANKMLGVPPDFVPASMIAVGYPDDGSWLTPEHQQREKAQRVRNPQSAFTFRGKWID